MYNKHILLCLLLCSITYTLQNAVHIDVQSGWAGTPVVSEVVEYLSSTDNHSDEMWDYIKNVGDLSKIDLDHQLEHIIKCSGVTGLGLKTLRYAISTRMYSPNVEAQMKYSDDRRQYLLAHNNFNCGNASIWAEVNDLVVCDVTQLDVSKMSSIRQTVFSFDHVLGSSLSDIPVVVLYAQVGTPEFVTWNNVLYELAMNGQITYVLRHSRTNCNFLGVEDHIRLQGYGAELRIKSTEYKVIDDKEKAQSPAAPTVTGPVAGVDFEILMKRYPNLNTELGTLKSQLMTASGDVSTDYKAWQMQNIGYTATAQVVAASDQIGTLKDISENLPAILPSLISDAKSDAITNEARINKQKLWGASEEADLHMININGRNFDLHDIGPHDLFAYLSEELDTINYLNQTLGFDLATSRTLSGHLLADWQSQVVPRLTVASKMVTWVNDLESDTRFHRWPSSYQTYLDGASFNQKIIRRNIYAAIYVFDPFTSEGAAVLNDIYRMISNGMPMRFGLVPVEVDHSERFKVPRDTLLKVMTYLSEDVGLEASLAFYGKILQSLYRQSLSVNEIEQSLKSVKKNALSLDDIADQNDKITVDSNTEYAKNVGIMPTDVPLVIFNGIVREKQRNSFNQMFNMAVKDQSLITSLIERRVLTDATKNTQKVIMKSLPSIPGRYNKAVVSASITNPYESDTDFHTIPRFIDVSHLTSFPVLSSDGDVIKSMSYFLIADFIDQKNLESARNLISVIFKSELAKRSRLFFIPVAARSYSDDWWLTQTESIKTLATDLTLSQVQGGADKYESAMRWLSDNTPLLRIKSQFVIVNGRVMILSDLVSDVDFALLDSYEYAVRDVQTLEKMIPNSDKLLQTLSYLGTRKLGRLVDSPQTVVHFIATHPKAYGPGHRYGISDGKSAGNAVYADALSMLTSNPESWSAHKFINAHTVISSSWSGVAYPYPSDAFGNRIKNLDNVLTGTATKISIGSIDTAVLHVEFVVNPLSHPAQRISANLVAMKELFGDQLLVTGYLSPVPSSDLPIKNFYRYVVDLTKADPRAVFSYLPPKTLFSTSIHVPDAWFVRASEAVYDMDNLRLEGIVGDVYATYSLVDLVVSGSASETNSRSRQGPSGLGLVLSTPNTQVSDSLVMANYGYYQLKAPGPGVYLLSIREGRARDFEKLDEKMIGGSSVLSQYNEDDWYADEASLIVAPNSYFGAEVPLPVFRRIGKEYDDLLGGLEQPKQERQEQGWWNNISGMFGTAQAFDPKNIALIPAPRDHSLEKLHIFSLATGHLYERFLKIMMRSVLERTRHPVKFWFVSNYFSPEFQNLLPKLAEKWGCEVELVTYRWPYWLTEQTEKQRIIWAYKILFLDVLFPLNLSKVIYVDADQVVRTDLYELWTMDLHGAPYGYTPFCNSRKETEPFRFWKTGFWDQHLAGKPYHISALYVIDLFKFRQMRAGDELRAAYQNLVRDPNSLANLDQDLPNFLQHEVPIFSLPQEWLWCETWCDDASFSTAKTIDLCQNPLTKSPKLDNAKRIIPEWIRLDEIASEMTRQLLAE